MKRFLFFALMMVAWAASTFATVNVRWTYHTDTPHAETGLEVGEVRYVAAKQPYVAQVDITNWDGAPISPWVTSNSGSALSVALEPQSPFGGRYIYYVTIPAGEQNPSQSRPLGFSVKDGNNGATTSYSFVQAAPNIDSTEGASYTFSKRRPGAAQSVFTDSSTPYTANTTPATTTPLPTTLDGISVYLTYLAGANKFTEICPLFFTSPTQINYIAKWPAGETASSQASLWVITPNNGVRSELFNWYASTPFFVHPIPSAFTKTTTGKGVPAMYYQVCVENTGNCTNYQIDPISSPT
jgi:hypothetical protein